MVAAAKIQAIYRYPVKGLSPEPLPRAWLAAGETLPGDRAYAIENGPSRFDPALPRYQPKTHYLMLMRNERLATLKTRFDAPSRTLVIARAGHEAARGDLGTAQGRAAIEAFFADFCADELRGSRRGSCMRRASASRTWPARWCRSSISHRSRRSPSGWARRSIRCDFAPTSIWTAGRPGASSIWSGRRSRSAASARLKIVKRIVRCAATNVDPDTGARDLAIPDALLRAYGHADCGIYGEVVAPGEIAVGDGVGGE